ncbi:hypothetical protein TNIN_109061 [Trichonephila inaurata madagascariensis]|uniref:Uncharacterized protein n=1 Tax=Trichonephila inaurata madagascariensis TaxID=2747483 RepID=A0A8X6X1E8_9ARAC|nr:hypothetical protein TNIN_109061 [Trichonephila inaurata madagascariensis]
MTQFFPSERKKKILRSEDVCLSSFPLSGRQEMRGDGTPPHTHISRDPRTADSCCLVSALLMHPASSSNPPFLLTLKP